MNDKHKLKHIEQKLKVVTKVTKINILVYMLITGSVSITSELLSFAY